MEIAPNLRTFDESDLRLRYSWSNSSRFLNTFLFYARISLGKSTVLYKVYDQPHNVKLGAFLTYIVTLRGYCDPGIMSVALRNYFNSY